MAVVVVVVGGGGDEEWEGRRIDKKVEKPRKKTEPRINGAGFNSSTTHSDRENLRKQHLEEEEEKE